jgi:hypothetical protein
VQPDPKLQRFAILLVVVGFAGLFTWLLIDTLRADASFEPRGVQTVLIPLFAGALGLVLALALGVDPKSRQSQSVRDVLRYLFWSDDGLLRLGAFVYLGAAVLGAIVWGIQQDETPGLVTAIVFTTAGYLAAVITSRARPGP